MEQEPGASSGGFVALNLSSGDVDLRDWVMVERPSPAAHVGGKATSNPSEEEELQAEDTSAPGKGVCSDKLQMELRPAVTSTRPGGALEGLLTQLTVAPQCPGSASAAATNHHTQEARAEREEPRPSTRGPSTRGPSTRGPSTRGPSTRGPPPTAQVDVNANGMMSPRRDSHSDCADAKQSAQSTAENQETEIRPEETSEEGGAPGEGGAPEEGGASEEGGAPSPHCQDSESNQTQIQPEESSEAKKPNCTKAESTGPEAESTGPEAESTGPEAGSTGPEAESTGPEAESTGPEAESTGPEAESTGPEAESTGPKAESRGPELKPAESPTKGKAKSPVPSSPAAVRRSPDLRPSRIPLLEPWTLVDLETSAKEKLLQKKSSHLKRVRSPSGSPLSPRREPPPSTQRDPTASDRSQDEDSLWGCPSDRTSLSSSPRKSRLPRPVHPARSVERLETNPPEPAPPELRPLHHTETR
uniref:Uncharacterized protein n=1 Tax=Knipowitschia caucasica TaxID=637954 RepID=A0AAV2JFB3_KNICA